MLLCFPELGAIYGHAYCAFISLGRHKRMLTVVSFVWGQNVCTFTVSSTVWDKIVYVYCAFISSG